MLNIGVFAPFGAEHESNIAFCRDAGVGHVGLGLNAFADDRGDTLPAAHIMESVAARYQQAGMQLAAVTPSRVRQAAFQDAAVFDEELGQFGTLVRNMGAAGIPYLHLYLNVDPLESEAARMSLWDGLVRFYGALTAIAGEAGVRISTHHFHRPDRLLWNYETMTRLLAEVPSPSNGVTFCQGKSQLAGDDVVRDILRYGERIFMFHIRDVVTQVDGPVEPEVEQRLAEMGYLEVAFGSGVIDIVGSIRALKQIDYQGQIYPEHYPSIAGEPRAGLAWTIGYIRALDQAVEG